MLHKNNVVMPKALIIFASLTGNTQQMADLLGEKLRALKVETEVVECMQTDPEEFEDFDICIIATYTYGTDGDLPDEMLDFYEDLESMDLSGKVYGVLGSGQHFYEHFCRAVEYFDEQFQKTNAVRGADSLKIELNVGAEEEVKLEQFAKNLIDSYRNLEA